MKWERCEPDDPNRCDAIGQGGQCPYKAIDGSTKCARHGGINLRRERKARLDNYKFNLATLQSDIIEKSNSPKAKTLREEIAITRALLEKIVNKCQNDDDLRLSSPTILAMVDKIGVLVTNCTKVDILTKTTLDKTTVISIAERIVQVISTYIEDEETLQQIVDEIQEIFEVASGD